MSEREPLDANAGAKYRVFIHSGRLASTATTEVPNLPGIRLCQSSRDAG